jgi:hypothetical protein
MPAYAIEDFKEGMDLRKTYVTAPAGSLRTLRNCFITAGAEIEKRTAFIPWATPDKLAGTMGCLSRNGEFFVVKNGPSGITDWTFSPNAPGYISLPFPSGVTIDRVADWDLFNGLFYIVLHGTNGLYYHYYDQVQVTDATPGFNPDLQNVSSIRVYGLKVYGVNGRWLRFSGSNKPKQWNPPDSSVADGSGYLDLSAQDSDSTNLVGLEVYYNQLAIFSNLSTQLWTVVSDNSQNVFRQLLRGTGLIANNGLTQFGNGDILFLSSHGIRSLRVQNVSLTAGLTDVGSPLDEEFRRLTIANGQNWFANARCLIQPRSGRLLVCLPDRIYCLTTFQQPAVTAWSMFDGLNFADVCIADPWVVLRSTDDNMYIYGNDVTSYYDSTEAEVITPALSCGSPSTNKLFHGFDVGAQGTWTLSVGCDPNNQATEETVATFTGATYVNPQMTMPESSTHISLRFRSTDASQARIGHVMLMYDEGLRD